MAHLAEILQKRSPVVNVFAPDQSVAEAVRTMAGRRVGCVLVAEESRLVGIFSERDLLRRVIAKGRNLEQTPLREVMTPDPITATPSETRKSAIVKMQAMDCRHLPILVQGQVVDTISIRDLLFDEIKERDSEIEQLKRYIQGQAPEAP